MLIDIEPSREQCLRYILWKLGQEHARLVLKPGVSCDNIQYDSDEWKEYDTNQAALLFVCQELRDIDVDPWAPPPNGTLIPGRKRKTRL